MDTVITAIVSILSFSTMIVIHEAGHLLAARKAGILVDSFSIGFGPSLFKKNVHGVTYQLSLLPIGGYVRMPETLSEDRSMGIPFHLASIRKKLCVLAAGSIANLLTGFIVMTVISIQAQIRMGGSLFLALKQTSHFFWETIRVSAAGIAQLLFSTSVSWKDVSGPLGVSRVLSDGLQTSPLYFFLIFAVISINIGVFNLVPIPALDGGRILFVGIERFMKEKFTIQIQEKLHGAGMFTLLLLVLAITIKDILQMLP